jgi:hypothetical protein
MAKGCIEWEHDEENGLVLRIKPGYKDMAATTAAAAEVIQHAMAANREILLTMKSMIDLAVQRTEEKAAKASQRATKIKVE